MAEPTPFVRIRPAPWFVHALSFADLVRLLERRLRALECGRDARAAFVRVRLAQLREVHAAFEAWRFGTDAAWVERLEIEHVHAFLRADDAWGRGQVALTPEPWRAIFVQCGRHGNDSAILAAATIAHLSYDLPLAIARAGGESRMGSAFEYVTSMYIESWAGAAALNAKRAPQRDAHVYATADWQRELRGQAWDDAADLTDEDEHVRSVAFTRIELAAVCEVRRAMQGALVDR
jgi:hypothetical protein